MYKIKVYKNGKLFAEYDVNEFLIVDEKGQAFVSTGEAPQQFLLNSMQKEEDSDILEPPKEKERKRPTQKDKMALKYLIDRMDKDNH